MIGLAFPQGEPVERVRLQGSIDGREELLRFVLGPGVWWRQGEFQRLVGAVSEREGKNDAFLRH